MTQYTDICSQTYIFRSKIGAIAEKSYPGIIAPSTARAFSAAADSNQLAKDMKYASTKIKRYGNKGTNAKTKTKTKTKTKKSSGSLKKKQKKREGLEDTIDGMTRGLDVDLGLGDPMPAIVDICGISTSANSILDLKDDDDNVLVTPVTTVTHQKIIPDVAKKFDRRRTIEPMFDASVFIGDLNYRLEIPRLEVEILKERLQNKKATTTNKEDKNNGEFISRSPFSCATVESGELGLKCELESLFEYDQLVAEKANGKVFAGEHWKEGQVTFLPTYKFDKGGDNYDSSSKRRNPAWTDRVLYDAGTGRDRDRDREGDSRDSSLVSSDKPTLELEEYVSVDSFHSDHRPVVANFRITGNM